MPTRTMDSLCALAAALVFALFPTFAAAQSSDTVYDEADVLSDSEEQQVQEEFDAAQQDAGQPLYAFPVPDTGVVDQAGPARSPEAGSQRREPPAGRRRHPGRPERRMGTAGEHRRNLRAGRLQDHGP